MKLNGRTLVPNVEVVVIPRQSGDLVFKAAAVLDYDEHDKLNPQPEPPIRLLPGGVRQQNIEDPKYIKAVDDWATNKFHWMFLKSLSATEGLEWETVKMDQPKTWQNYKAEMSKAGITPGEVARIEMLVTDACGLNQQKIDEATKRFLAGQAQAQSGEHSPSSGQNTTPSGVPASAGA